MEWKIKSHDKSTDGKTEHTHCQLWLDFPGSTWNKKPERPVMELYFKDYKKARSWNVGRFETKWFTQKPHKICEIFTFYFQSSPNVKLYSGENYDGFTLEYCQQEAVKLLLSRLDHVKNQIIPNPPQENNNGR